MEHFVNNPITLAMGICKDVMIKWYKKRGALLSLFHLPFPTNAVHLDLSALTEVTPISISR
jgi:hypothetical protein